MLSDLGLAKGLVSNWKKRGTVPSGDILLKIADYFGVSTDYLIKDEEIISGWLEQIIYKLSKELNQPRERLIGFLMDYQKKVSDLAKYEEEFTADEEQLRIIFKNYLAQEKAVPTEQPLSNDELEYLRLIKTLTDDERQKLIDYAELLKRGRTQ